MNRFIPYAFILLLSACAAPAPQSKPPAQGWQVVVAKDGKNGQLCYAAAIPASSEGTIGARTSSPYLMVTRRMSGKLEVSASAGYPFKPGSKAELAIDDDAYGLFYKGSVAWAWNDGDDDAIVESMPDAEDIQLRGLSQSGLTSVDHYPSHGFAAALDRIRTLCP